MPPDPLRVEKKLLLALESTILQNVTNLEQSLGYLDAAIPGESHSAEIYDAMGKVKAIMESLSNKAAKAINSSKAQASAASSSGGSKAHTWDSRFNNSSSSFSEHVSMHHPKVAQKHSVPRNQRWDLLYSKEPAAKAIVKKNVDNLSKLAEKSLLSSSFDTMKSGSVPGSPCAANVSHSFHSEDDTDSKKDKDKDKETEKEEEEEEEEEEEKKIREIEAANFVVSHSGKSSSPAAQAPTNDATRELQQSPSHHTAPSLAVAEPEKEIRKVVSNAEHDDLEAKLAAIDLKRKVLEKKTSAKRQPRVSDPSSSPVITSTTTTTAGSGSGSGSDAGVTLEALLPVTTQDISPVRTDRARTGTEARLGSTPGRGVDLGDDLLPIWGSAKNSPEALPSSRVHGGDIDRSFTHHSPYGQYNQYNTAASRGYGELESPRYSQHSLSRNSSTGTDNGRDGVESPIPALFMAGAGGEALEFDASMVQSYWITGAHDGGTGAAAADLPPASRGASAVKKSTQKGGRRAAPAPPVKIPLGSDSSSFYRSPGSAGGNIKPAPVSHQKPTAASAARVNAKFSNHTGSGYEAI